VAYLTERHNIELRDALRHAAAAAKGSAAPSPIPGAEGVLGHQRTGSALSARRDSPLPRAEGSGVGTPVTTVLRPNISRNASDNAAITHNLGGGTSPRLGKPAAIRTGEGQGQRRRLSSLPMVSTPREEQPPSPGPADTSSDDTSDDSIDAQSRIIRRPPRFATQDTASPFGDEDDEDTDPAFGLPKRTSTDLGDTLRVDGRRGLKGRERIHQSQTSDSSTSSAAMVPRNIRTSSRAPPGPLSPKRTAELAGRSPGGKGKDVSREGSDGTPSMGSSYSDLDGSWPHVSVRIKLFLIIQMTDSSVTHSALAEALAAGMQDGAIGSRLSIAQSISRRFVPRKNN